MEKTRPTAHSTNRDQPQLKSLSVVEDADPFGDPVNPIGGGGAEGGTPVVLFPKEKNEHDLPVSFLVALVAGPAGGVKLGRPPPSHQRKPAFHKPSRAERRGPWQTYDKVLFTKNSLERKNLAPSRRHAQNSTLCLTSKRVCKDCALRKGQRAEHLEGLRREVLIVDWRNTLEVQDFLPDYDREALGKAMRVADIHVISWGL